MDQYYSAERQGRQGDDLTAPKELVSASAEEVESPSALDRSISEWFGEIFAGEYLESFSHCDTLRQIRQIQDETSLTLLFQSPQLMARNSRLTWL